MFLTLFLFECIVSISTCSFAAETSSGIEVPAKTPHNESIGVGLINQLGSDQIAQIQLGLKLADNIYLETLKVIAPKHKVSKSPFLRIFESFGKLVGDKTSAKGYCQQYQVNSVGQVHQVKLACDKKKNLTLFTLQWTQKNKIVNFYADAMPEILGDSASILGKSAVCRFDGNSTLREFTCERIYQKLDQNQMIVFKKLHFQSSKDSLVTAEGEWLDNLFPVRSFKAQIPQQGNIKLTEKVLYEPPRKKEKSETLKMQTNTVTKGELSGKDQEKNKESSQENYSEISKESNKEDQTEDQGSQQNQGQGPSEVVPESQGGRPRGGR